jgi:nicotinamide riboside kinase
MTLTVAVLGAECTGKSTLCEALGAVLSAIVIPETLRNFCELNHRTPRADEQTLIIQSQVDELRRIKAQRPPYIVMDCAPITTALYSQMYFDDDSLVEIASDFHRLHIDLTLTLEPEFNWQPDRIPWMRDSQTMQARFDQLLGRWLLSHSDLNVAKIGGTHQERIFQAIAVVRQMQSTLANKTAPAIPT